MIGITGFRPSRRAALIALTVFAAATINSGIAMCADWPTRTITIIVPFAAGGGSDFAARMIAQPLSEALKVPVIVQNRGGGGGNIGIVAASRATPDGYTLLTVSSAFEVNASLYERAGYDPIKDFIPLVNIGAAPDVLVVPAASRFRDFGEFIAYAKANPGKLNWASPGVGTTPYLAVERLKSELGINMVHIPFPGAGPATQAALAGELDMYAANMGSLLGQIHAGTLRPIVQTGSSRWPDLPNVPRLEDVGFSAFVSETHQSMYLPAGTPQEILDRLAKEVLAILRRPEVKERFLTSGLAVVNEGPSQFKARVVREVAMYKDIIDRIGLKIR
jgi:tripartite-type tricarboxylate transporter receptor subunit TctC